MNLSGEETKKELLLCIRKVLTFEISFPQLLFLLGEEPLTYTGEFESAAILKWLMAEGFPLVEELAQPIWMRSSQASAPLLAVFHEETDSATQEIVCYRTERLFF